MRVFCPLLFRGAFAFAVLFNGPFKPVAAQPEDELGEWEDLFPLAVIPIHVILLPDSQILMYGTDDEGKQGGDIFYEVWDPRSGDHQNHENHKLLQHSTDVNIFCTTSTIDISTGNYLLIGGDDGDNNGVTDVLEFDTKTLEMRQHPQGHLTHPRWYATSVGLPNGDILVVGGKGRNSMWESAVCELWTPNQGFRELSGTAIPAIKEENDDSWWYPIVAINSSGDIILVIADGTDTDVYLITVDGEGSIETVGKKPFSMDKLGPSIMFDIDRVLMVDKDGGLWVANISDSKNIEFTKKNNVGTGRSNGALNVLPNGRVIFTGGSNTDEDNGNEVDWAVKYVQIWDPVANTIYRGPEEELPRLYHSSALILPDGSVYSGGGGAPGPLTNLNGNIYKPSYLFDPRTGEKSSRPVILSWPRNLQPREVFAVTVDDAISVEHVTMTKPGAMTHSRNCDHRWLELDFVVVNKRTLKVYAPNGNVLIPGLWMVNVISSNGFLSEGRLLGVDMAAATNIYVPEDLDLSTPTEPPASAPPVTGHPSESPTIPSLPPTQQPSEPQPTFPPTQQSSEPQPTLPPTQQSSEPIPTPPPTRLRNGAQPIPAPTPTRQPTDTTSQTLTGQPFTSITSGEVTWQVSVSPP